MTLMVIIIDEVWQVCLRFGVSEEGPRAWVASHKMLYALRIFLRALGLSDSLSLSLAWLPFSRANPKLTKIVVSLLAKLLQRHAQHVPLICRTGACDFTELQCCSGTSGARSAAQALLAAQVNDARLLVGASGQMLVHTVPLCWSFIRAQHR